MGFSGGGSNVLLPHTHDGTVAQDGGALNFNNITQSQSALGQMFYSDGVHLQQLSIGAPNDEIRVSGANLPEWYTPAAATSLVTLLGSQELAAPASQINITYPSVSFADVSAIDIYWSGHQTAGNDWRFHFNGIGANYTYQWTRVTGGAQSAGQIVAGTEIYTQPNDDIGSGHVRLICQDPSTTAGANQLMMYEGEMVGFNTNTYFTFGGFIASTTITASDAVRLYVPAGNISTGGVMSVYSTSRT